MGKITKEQIFKTFGVVETKAADGNGRTLVVKITSPTPDRSHDIVVPMGMVADNYLKNPVVLYAHDYRDLPIGKCTDLKAIDTGVLATVQFPNEGDYPKADQVYSLYKQGILNAWSIGFMPLEFDENDGGGHTFTKWELFEFSAVPVPDNAEALTIMRSKGIDVDLLLEKGVIAYKETPKAPEGDAWDAGAEVKAASPEDLKVMCTWVDSANEDKKTAYKLPHHKQAGDHAVVWRGVAAAMGAVLGARGGTKIPSGDRKGVYNHLAKHYAQFEKEPPEFKEYSPNELYDLDTKGIVDIGPTLTVTKELFAEMIADTKAGRTISGKHEALLSKACEHMAAGAESMKNSMDCVKEVLASVAENPEEPESNPDDDEGKMLNGLSRTQAKNLIETLKKADQSVGLTLRLLKALKKSAK